MTVTSEPKLGPEGYPMFSEEERSRRRRAITGLLERSDVTCVVVYGEKGSSAIPWLTGWFATHLAAAVVQADEPIDLLVQRYNHVSNATRMAHGVNVRFAGADGRGELVRTVAARTTAGDAIGWIGPLTLRMARAFEASGRNVIDLTAEYQELRQVKSTEELDWIRRGVELTDRSLQALLDTAHPGSSEWELIAAVEQAYLGQGGTNHLHYVATTPMSAPSRYVPAQWPSARRLAAGDAIVTELSASYWGYPGQVLRTIAVASEPEPLYRELHDVAEATFAAVAERIRAGVHVQELVDAADLIDGAGFALGDDLLHGFGGGYLPPVLRTRHDAIGAVPDMRLQAGMTIVLQPNVITRDLSAGVQTGEMMVVTDDGYELLHAAPRGFLRTA